MIAQPGAQARMTLGNRDRLEELLIELSSRFVNVPSEQVDREITDAQRRICEHLELDRSSLWQPCADDSDRWVMTHIYQHSDMPLPPAETAAKSLFPWFLQQVRRGKTVDVAKLDDLPAEAAHDRETLLRVGTKSTVVIPLAAGSIGLGALTFASAREREIVPADLMKRLQVIADVFSNALARARIERALRESEERHRAVIESAVDGIICIDSHGLIDVVNSAAANMFGYDPEELIGRNVSLLMPDADRVAHDSYLADYLKTGTKRIIGIGREVVGRRKDDSTFPMDLAISEVRLPDNRHIFTGIVRDISQRKQAEEELRRTLDEVKKLRDQLHQENRYLKQQAQEGYGPGRLVGRSSGLKHVLTQSEQVAPTDSTVLLLGETGTGKELIAAAIHELSPRKDRTMVRVNCAALPASLLEGELFGREKGAYTGALSKQIGRFEMAHGSTLFLDEIGDLPLEVQVKLLRSLQEKQIERLGSSKTLAVDVRIIAATNRDLEKAVREGRFREDLYYRLNVFPITVPPLRERREDIPALVSAFVEEFAARFGKNIESIATESMEALQRYHWPGNVRELRNMIERAMIVTRGPRLWVEPPLSTSTPSLSMNAAEERHLRQVLETAGRRIRGKNGAAALLELRPSTLESRMAKLGIHRNGRKPT